MSKKNPNKQKNKPNPPKKTTILDKFFKEKENNAVIFILIK